MALLTGSGITTIEIDIDDVLADCTIAAMHHMGLLDYTIDDYAGDLGRNIYEAYNRKTGILYTPAQFWEHFKREWWATLPQLEFCHELISLSASEVGNENVALLTSPTKCGDCLGGKLDWITDNLPKWIHRQYVMTPRKGLCAAPHVLLIDDAEENAAAFTAKGGHVILYPRPWNRARAYVHDEFGYVVEEMRLLGEKLRHRGCDRCRARSCPDWDYYTFCPYCGILLTKAKQTA